MSSLTIGLRCLKHPLTLASVGLLLLNDHVLKVVMPSPLTGKLSDLAGLFFFPFLLAVSLGLILDRVRVPARRTVALAFGLTLIWFTLVKTWPWANALTATAPSMLLGWPVLIARDPTDLIALAVLWPAWQLWLQLEQTPSQKSPGKAAYLALGLASLATLATAPCPPQVYVTRLVISEQSIYAGLSYRNDYGVQTGPEFGRGTARSDDGGRTWTGLGDDSHLMWTAPGTIPAPEQVTRQLAESVQFPVVVCDPQHPQTCYRITGASQSVEGSTDGGQTWRVAWQLPWGRQRFMEYYLTRRLMSCKQRLDIGPYDMVLLSRKTYTLVVAAGNEGVIVRTPEGIWERYATAGAVPTPFTGTGLDMLEVLWMLVGEGIILFVAAVLAWLVLCALGWHLMLLRLALPSGRAALWAIAPVVCSAALYLLGDLLLPSFSFSSTGALWILITSVAGLLVLIMPLLAWRRVANLSSQHEAVGRAAWTCMQSAWGIFPLAWLSFLLWVYGVVPTYEIAWALAVLIGVVTVIWGLCRIREASRQLATPNK
jgi:hypothetical protein